MAHYASKCFREKSAKGVFFLSALTSIFFVVLICLFLFSNGIPAIAKIGIPEFLFGSEWAPTDEPPSFGIFPMILGSLFISVGSIFIGGSIGLFSAIYLAKFCPEKAHRILRPAIDLLAGIPSVVYGFFGLMVIVPLIRQNFGGTGACILSASILLGIMILPTIVSVSEAALRAVPSHYYEGALALGDTCERSIFRVILPAAASGISAGFVLGFGRAIGETMAVILVAGNQARIPESLLDGVRTLTANIALEMGYAADLHREALIATGTVLFAFILIINILFSILKKKAIQC